MLMRCLRATQLNYVNRQLVRTLTLAQPSLQKRVYAKSHEWVLVDANGGKGTVGISNHAQEALGDIVYVETAALGTQLKQGDIAGTVESVKAASDIYAPVSGTVVERNEELDTNPHLLNKSPYEKGWLYKVEIKEGEELKTLMSESEYEAYLKASATGDE